MGLFVAARKKAKLSDISYILFGWKSKGTFLTKGLCEFNSEVRSTL